MSLHVRPRAVIILCVLWFCGISPRTATEALLHDVSSSLRSIRVIHGELRGLLVAIDPRLNDTPQTLTSVQKLITEAAEALRVATNLTIKHVDILLPSTWTAHRHANVTKLQRLRNADVIITSRAVSSDMAPGVKAEHGGRCGQRGRRVLVHRDAIASGDDVTKLGAALMASLLQHVFGVFPETPRGRQSYTDVDGDVYPATCPRAQPVDWLPNSNCHPTAGAGDRCGFISKSPNTKSASVLANTSLDNVVYICEGPDSSPERRHNPLSPTVHNHKCDGRSVQEVMSAQVGSNWPSEPSRSNITFNLLKERRPIKMVLLLDDTVKDKDRRRNIAREIHLNLRLRQTTATQLSLVRFCADSNSSRNFQWNSTELDGDYLRELAEVLGNWSEAANLDPLCSKHIANYESREVTPSAFGSALGLVAMKILGHPYSVRYGAEIVLVTGAEEDASSNQSKLRAHEEELLQYSGVRVHVVLTGPGNTIGSLSNMSAVTGGQEVALYGAGGSQEGFLDQIFDAIYHPLPKVLAERLTVNAGSIVTKTFHLPDEASVWVLATFDEDCPVGLILSVTDGPQMDLCPTTDDKEDSPSSSSSRLGYSALFVPSLQKGFQYVTSINSESDAVNFVLTVSEASEKVVGLDSYIEAKIEYHQLNLAGTLDLNPQTFSLDLSQWEQTLNGVMVTANVQTPAGNVSELSLYDDGKGADGEPSDQVYSCYFQDYDRDGVYSVHFSVDLGYNIDDTQRKRRSLLTTTTRWLYGGTFRVVNTHAWMTHGRYPPQRVADLEASIDQNILELRFTAPGASLDQGKAYRYEFLMSSRPQSLLNIPSNGTTVELVQEQLNKGQLNSPKPALRSELFRFRLLSGDQTEPGVYFVGLRAQNGHGRFGRMSNIAPYIIPRKKDPAAPTRIMQTLWITAVVVFGMLTLLCSAYGASKLIRNCASRQPRHVTQQERGIPRGVQRATTTEIDTSASPETIEIRTGPRVVTFMDELAPTCGKGKANVNGKGRAKSSQPCERTPTSRAVDKHASNHTNSPQIIISEPEDDIQIDLRNTTSTSNPPQNGIMVNPVNFVNGESKINTVQRYPPLANEIVTSLDDDSDLGTIPQL